MKKIQNIEVRIRQNSKNSSSRERMCKKDKHNEGVGQKNRLLGWLTMPLLIVVSSSVVSAQPYIENIGASKGGSLGKEELIQVEREGTYFTRWDARLNSEEYDKQLRKSMRTLYLIVKNYGGSLENAPTRFEEVSRLFKVAKYYQNRRFYLASENEYAVASEKMNMLIQDYERVYRNRLIEILSISADRLTDVDLELSNRYESAKKSPPKYIEKNDNKLKIANYHLDEGARHNFYGRYLLAIDHYRVGKVFAIAVLEGLELDLEKRKQLRKQYNSDLRDARKLLVNRTPVSQ